MENELFLSKSSVDTYSSCGLKFKLRYIDRQDGKSALEEKQSAIFGSLIHSVLEEYFGSGKSENLLDLYKGFFIKSELTNQELFIAGEQLLKDYAKDSDNGNKILCVEKDFKFYLDNGVPVKGFIDRIDEISPDEIEIIDYKTGYSPPLNQSQLEKDLQLSIYTLAVKQLYPQYKKVKASLHYLHYGKVSCEISDENLSMIKDYLNVMYEKMSRSIESGSNLEPRINSYCSFCDYKSLCPEFQKIIKIENKDIAQQHNALISHEKGLVVNLEDLDLFLESLNSKKRILKKIEDETKAFIKRYIEENGGEARKSKIGNTYYSLASRKSLTYNVKIFLEICKEKGINPNKFLSVSKTEVDKLFEKDEESIKQLKATASVNYGESYIR